MRCIEGRRYQTLDEFHADAEIDYPTAIRSLAMTKLYRDHRNCQKCFGGNRDAFQERPSTTLDVREQAEDG